MKIKGNIIDKITTILMAILYALFIILDRFEYKNYIFLFISIVIFLLSRIKYNSLKIQLTKFHKSTTLFFLFCFISMFWAQNPLYSKNQAISILYNLIVLFFVNAACQSDDNISKFIFAIKWGGVIIALYSFAIYGVSGIINTIHSGMRLDNEFGNSNDIAIQGALSIVIFMMDYLVNVKKRTILSIFACTPSMILIASSGTRKAILILAIGFFMAFYWYIKNTQTVSKKIQRFAVFAFACIFVILLISNMSMFNLILDRMKNIGFGNNKIKEQSAQLRSVMIIGGWKQFLKTPLLGIGIGCPRILNLSLTGMDAYLHNNYIELLCGGGLVGFILYYKMYYYNLKLLIRSNIKTKEISLCLTLIVINLMLDWSMVSYYSISNYFIIMMCFIQSKLICYNNYIQKKN